ncbi:MAG: hypothetical protein ACLTXH_08640 [Enterobacter hormaechei]
MASQYGWSPERLYGIDNHRGAGRAVVFAYVSPREPQRSMYVIPTTGLLSPHSWVDPYTGA